ncbi:MAG: efflux transporter outer membrane subunit [Acidocella sp.]|nr:efflux transporter outer membrane subunit [Acidocella sp.]
MRIKAALALGLVLGVAGCAPPLAKPDLKMVVSGYVPGAPAAAPNGVIEASWWRIFKSPALNALVARGLAANPGIGEATANLAAANENGAATDAAFLPQVILGNQNSPTISRQSYPTGPNGYPPYTVYTLNGAISYDPGLFGARKYSFENGAAQAAYQAALLAAARQSVAGNIAAAAIGLAGIQAQITVTQRIIAAEHALLTLLQGEYQDGAITQLSVLQQQSAMVIAEASLPPLQAQADVLRDRLAVLSGSLPVDFSGPEVSLDALTVPADLPVELPSAYLANRPDIRAARAEVAAQNAALGVAVAHLYPDISLTAQGGYASEAVGSLFEPGAALWTLAGNLLAPIYEGGALHDRKAQAQAQLAAALDAYRQAVLTAFGQAADALQAIKTGQAALDEAHEAAALSAQAFDLARAQYGLGAVDYNTVLTAQGSAARAALNLVQARTNLLLDVATLQAAMAK